MIVDTPKEVTDIVKGFCYEIGSINEPIWVDVLPEQNAVEGDCFFNVQNLIEEKGGSIQYGWQIWECEGHFIEAEFHAVWKSENGNLVDITPKDRPTSRILFVPENNKKYDGNDVENIRKSLSSNKLVSYILSLAHEEYKMISAGRIGSSMNINMDQSKYRNIQTSKSLLVNMVDDNMTRNSLCACRSGNKFKHCHEKSIKNLIN